MAEVAGERSNAELIQTRRPRVGDPWKLPIADLRDDMEIMALLQFRHP